MDRMRLESRPGVSLVETLVAITLMAVVLSGLGGMAFTASRQTVTLTGTNLRQGILSQEVNRLTAWPFDDLASSGGCTTVSAGTFPHTRCITVSTVNNTTRRVRIIVTPTQPGIRPDTATFDRARAPVGSVLSTS